MSYLERNSRLIKEVGTSMRLKSGTLRGESRNMKFSSVGVYHSEEVGQEVYIGIKEPKEKDKAFWREFLKQRFIFELAVMSVVAENMPHLLPELPLFYGLLVNNKGIPIAIVTEDFSRDGQNFVNSPAAEPQGFRELFVEGTLDDDLYAILVLLFIQ